MAMRRWIDRQDRDMLRKAAAEWLDGTASDIANGPRRATHWANGNVSDGALRQRLLDSLWLLDDLGWDEYDPRPAFYLSMAEDRLARFLTFIADQSRGYAEDSLIPWHAAPDSENDKADATALLNQELDIYSAAIAVLEAS